MAREALTSSWGHTLLAKGGECITIHLRGRITGKVWASFPNPSKPMKEFTAYDLPELRRMFNNPDKLGNPMIYAQALDGTVKTFDILTSRYHVEAWAHLQSLQVWMQQDIDYQMDRYRRSPLYTIAEPPSK